MRPALARSRRGRKAEPRIVDIDRHPRPAVCLAVAAAWLGLAPSTVAARIDAGTLEAEVAGRRYRIPVAGLKAYAASRNGIAST